MTRFLEARRSWESATRISTSFPFHLLPKVSHASIHWELANHTFSSHPKFLELTFSRMTWAYTKSMQYSSGKESPRDFPSHESRLILACLMTASGRLHMCSLHLITLHLVPCTLFNTVMRTFLATKSFTEGSSMDPCHWACVLKSVPRDIIPSIGCSTQLLRSAVGVTCVSRGWLLNVPFSRSSWSSGFLRCFAHDNMSEQSLLAETLEGTLCRTPQVTR